MQAGSHTNLLLLVVIAEKEISETWGDAVATFKWVMQQVVLALRATNESAYFSSLCKVVAVVLVPVEI